MNSENGSEMTRYLLAVLAVGKSKAAGKILEHPSGLGWRKLRLCPDSSNMLSCLFSMINNTFNLFYDILPFEIK